MSSFRARVAALTLAIVSLSVFWPSPADAASTITVIVTDVDSWQRFAERHVAALGLGVNPDSRDPLHFIEEVGTGAPTGRPGARSVVRGSPGMLGRTLASAGRTVYLLTADEQARAALKRAFAGASVVEQERDPMNGVLPTNLEGPAIVIGLGAKTPLWVAICRGPNCSGQASELATGGIARRPAIVTPYDLAATILDIVDVEPSDAFVGKALTSAGATNALARLRKLASHLERGAGLGATMGATATVMAIAALAVGLMLRWGGRRKLSARAGQAATFAAAGYMGALFVPSGDGTIRALAIAVGVVAGAAIGARRPGRTVGRITLVIVGLFALLVVLAPLRPHGLPGAALWGNPLISWRFFGLQNFEVSFLAASIVIWGVLARLQPVPFAVLCLAATVVIGAPRVGSNFVGVLTIAFGGSLALIALVRRRVELWHAIAAAAIAAAAFVLALLADAGSPVSHGGRAAQRISEGGLSTLVDFVEARLRLNVDLIRGFPAGLGFVFMAAMLAIAGALMVWGARPERPQRARIAVWAGAAMALVSLVLEDSGFYAGPIILVTAAAAWMIATASDEEDELSSPASVPAPASGG
jgi:hypothetical protein